MRNKILKGFLPFPSDTLLEKYPDKEEVIFRMWRAVWYNYLNGCSTNSLYWYESLGGKLFNEVVRRLSDSGWVTSSALPGRKWADISLCTDKLLEYVTKDKLEGVKASNKYARYRLTCEESTVDDVTRQGGVNKRTGLVREGFAKSGNCEFSLDVDMLEKYEDAIALNLTKGMKKCRELHKDLENSLDSYDNVSERLLEHYIENDETYSTGPTVSDSRGRNISSSLNQVGNILSFKDFRSCIIIN